MKYLFSYCTEDELEKNGIKITGKIPKRLPILRYPELAEDNPSLLNKYLTQSLWRELRALKTTGEGHISNCIVAGVENPTLPVGVYACDANAYFQYRKLFHPIIKDCHDYEVKDDIIIKHDFDLSKLEWNKLDRVMHCLNFVQVSASRNIDGYSFLPTLDSIAKGEIEERVSKVIEDMDVKVEIDKMSAIDKKKLLDEKFLFDRHPSIEAIIPNAKCSEKSFVYYKNDLSQVVLINTDDHVNFFVTQKNNANLKLSCETLFNQLKHLEDNITLCKDLNLGYLTCNPTNLGTTLKMKVVVKLDKTTSEQVNNRALHNLCEQYKVSMNQIGERTYEFVQDRTLQLGKTEVDIVNGLLQCISEVLKAEDEKIVLEEAKAAESAAKIAEIKEKVESMKVEEEKEKVENQAEVNIDPNKEEDKYFTNELLTEYADTKTSSGLTISDIKAVSDANANSSIPVFIESAESFLAFNKLYSNALRIISNESFKFEEFNYNLTELTLKPLELPIIPETGIGKVIQISRNVDKIPFPFFMKSEDRTKLANDLITILKEFEVTYIKKHREQILAKCIH